MSDSVPVRPFPEDNPRVQELKRAFTACYEGQPEFYVRVPGRVNLIGEHIDYCGYGVCPMALEQDILLAVGGGREQRLRLHNLDDNYGDFECQLNDFSISTGDGAPQWHQYFLCGIRGIFDILPEIGDVRGMDVVVDGRIPPSAGLSSSSALVSAAALATAHINNLPLSKEKIASLCADCERHIGTQGGGMDQAIAFLATEGCAKLIEFSPLRSTDVSLPQGAVFVVAHSLAKLNKAATADFNCRVVECRLAAQIVAKKRGLDWTQTKRLGDLQKALAVDLLEMIRAVEETLHEDPYTKEEVLQQLETTADVLDDISLTQNTRHIEKFRLRQRALHVFREALRVEQFHAVCSQPADAATHAALGRLMADSHRSLRDLYECSHPQLDELVELSRDLTFGARLTGAGWGGCTVALLPKRNLDSYTRRLKEEFYTKYGTGDVDGVLFATEPKGGACIFSKE